MHQDYLRALVNNEDFKNVRSRLRLMIDKFSDEMKAEIDQDYTMACNIKKGLEMPEDSFAYQFSNSFLCDANAAEEKKTDLRKNFEAHRQMLEEYYEQLLKNSIESRKK